MSVTTQVSIPVEASLELDPAYAIKRLFAYPFHAAPTADLLAEGTAALGAGVKPGAVIDFLLTYPGVGTPFDASVDSDAAFCAAIVDGFCQDSSISAATRAGWVQELLPVLAASASRGVFVEWLCELVDLYTGPDADVLALKGVLAERMTRVDEFLASAEGAHYTGGGWDTLQAALVPEPEPPTYALSASVASVDEGGSLVFTLDTTHVAAGTTLPYTLSGTGITADDVLGGSLSGSLVVDAQGRGQLTVSLRADTTTEGVETLQMQLDGGLAAASVSIADTSRAPDPVPTYALSATATSLNEGQSITITLTTTLVRAGTTVPFTLSGSGIDANDIDGGLLAGEFTVNAEGLGKAIFTIRADQTTEGAETLRLRLTNRSELIDIAIVDTSLTPAPVGTRDVTVLADDMNNPRAHAPATPAEGEIRIETFLNYDLLDQSGPTPSRMTLTELRTSGPTAGAALDTTNSSADRGNIPQVSNVDLYTFDLGLEVDLVDYSAESGRVVAIISAEEPATQQRVLVNDDATDAVYDDATDRVDRLRNVEEVAASLGGGVLDLTPSGQDWLLTFSHGFDSGDVVASLDRAVHRVTLSGLDDGQSYSRSYLEYRDAGLDSQVTQGRALWSDVQGSDHDETLVFSANESQDQRLNVLRGGDNAVKYNELTRSILVDVAIVPWADSTDPADDGNASGQLTATARFTTGNGTTLLSARTHVTSSHTPDNEVAPGSLHLAGTQDAEDALSFDGADLAKIVTLGDSVHGTLTGKVRIAAMPQADAMTFTGFEILHDSSTSDDLYRIADIDQALGSGPRLEDAGSSDHDGIAIGNDALGSTAVGGDPDKVLLATLSGAAGFDTDFDVLDLSAITQGELAVAGTAGTDDELVLGALAHIDSTTLFEALVLTDASTDKGNVLVLDLDAGTLDAGVTTLFSFAGSILSAGGLVFGSHGANELIAPMSVAMTLRVQDSSAGSGATLWGGDGNDTLRGDEGDDILRGGGGNDDLQGGLGEDRFVFEASGAANGQDTIDEFAPADDKLDLTAFTGVAIGGSSAAIDADVGGNLAGEADTVELVFNADAGVIDKTDFAADTAVGKLVMPDGTHCVVIVTADATGAAGDAANTPMRVYYVTNGELLGTSDLSVTLVGTVNSDDELTLAQMVAAVG